MTIRCKRGVVGEILIDDPTTRNALSTSILRDIATAVAGLSTTEACRVVVIAGAGGTFSSGGNLKEEVPIEEVVAATTSVYEAITASNVPVLARVEGRCLGLAVGLVAACDLAITARDTDFALPEPHMGQVPTMASVTIVPRLRPADAAHLLLTGTHFDGDHARDVGLVNQSVERPLLIQEQQRWTDQLIRGGPEALAACKRLIRTMTTADRHEAVRYAAEMTGILAESDEAAEGKAAFLSRRLPVWQTDFTVD